MEALLDTWGRRGSPVALMLDGVSSLCTACGVVVGVLVQLLHGVVVGKKDLALASQLWSHREYLLAEL